MADTTSHMASQHQPSSGLYDNASAKEVQNLKNETHSIRSDSTSSRIVSGGYHYGTVTHQLRTAQLVANGIGAVCLYSEADRMGLGNFLLPVVFLLAQILVVGKRWYHSIDGRFDFKQMLSVADSRMKVQYAINVFGGFVLALMVHWMTAEIPSALSSLGFHLTDYLAIVASFASLALDIFEGTRQKLS
ncbi:hypothetical protein QR680_011397 [Steinernema hermaphroditum]|uniref:DUF7087 domain-containing protein n=1 Tax=Steinernema hermaphroditum TaxID=289476 RepID=A0AA39IS71_9BILA|nr:hypothetical protein QR680_011397 [Steinernema hermaphroditum]